MPKYPGGVGVSGYIAPTDTADLYATHKAQFGYGGYRSVADINARDNITSLRREEGMVVYVISDKVEYRLVGGLLNTNWVKVESSGSGAPSAQSYITVDNILDREVIPNSLRMKGMIVYVIDEDTEYRLVGGITNDNWKKIVTESVKQNYVIVPTLADIENYPMSDRLVGLKVYAADVDREFKLFGGIDNSNWIEIQYLNITTTTTDPDPKQPDNYYITNNTNIEYFNTFGALDSGSISQIILGNTGDNSYIKDGKPVPSVEDSKVFSFKINSDKAWFGDWIAFSGTTNLEPLKVNEVFLVIKQNGNSEVFDLFKLINASTNNPKIQVSGTKSVWYGYLKPQEFGKCEITVYQTQDSIKLFNINKTIYLFKPNFVITDKSTGTIVPAPITITNGIVALRQYSFKVLGETNLIVRLAKINENEKGIDTINYSAISSTTKNITSDIDFDLLPDILRAITVFGKYALVVTGIDNGINIPPYFYGPFLINKV